MNIHTIDDNKPVVATLISDDTERLNCLPRLFSTPQAFRFENAVYDFATHCVGGYKGGLWDFYTLSNGGFFMVPRVTSGAPLTITSLNGSSEVMPADSVGIALCLFAYSHLSFHEDGEVFAQQYHKLREYMVDHPSVQQILTIID